VIITEALESVNELWEKFNKDLMHFEKIMRKGYSDGNFNMAVTYVPEAVLLGKLD